MHRMTRFLTRLLNLGNAAALAFAVGAAALATAWGFQLIGGYVPCKLCLEQRIPYYIGLPILALAVILAVASAPIRYVRWLLVLAGVTFVVGAGLGVYHAGVEWNFWLGPNDCAGAFVPSTSAADLLGQLSRTHVVSCTEASWRFLGLSFAGWNVIASTFVALVAFIGARAPATP
jgi:disulfide bond formation protein DsbB